MNKAFRFPQVKSLSTGSEEEWEPGHPLGKPSIDFLQWADDETASNFVETDQVTGSMGTFIYSTLCSEEGSLEVNLIDPKRMGPVYMRD